MSDSTKPKKNWWARIWFCLFVISTVGWGAVALWLFICTFTLQTDATRFARQVGWADAQSFSAKGRRVVVSPVFHSPENGIQRHGYEMWTTGEKDGEDEIWFVHGGAYMKSWPTRTVIEHYCDGFNTRMRLGVEHPEWWDSKGNRVNESDREDQ